MSSPRQNRYLTSAQRCNLQKRQKGLYVVEFALAGGVFLFIMFSAIEVSRLMFTWSALDAMTQRGARVAAICPLNDSTVTQVAIFGSNGGQSLLPNISASNISVRYLNNAGAVVGNRNAVRFVEVSIQNYTHQMLIPPIISGFIAPLLTAPPFTTTRPAESLGRNPGGADFC